MGNGKARSVNDPFHIGEKLRALRLRDNYTLEQVAEALQVSYNTLSDYENGKVNVSHDKVLLAAKFFDVQLGSFYSTEGFTFVLHDNQQANGYVNEQHNVSKDLLDRFMAHIDARDKRMEEILAQTLEMLRSKL